MKVAYETSRDSSSESLTDQFPALPPCFAFVGVSYRYFTVGIYQPGLVNIGYL